MDEIASLQDEVKTLKKQLNELTDFVYSRLIGKISNEIWLHSFVSYCRLSNYIEHVLKSKQTNSEDSDKIKQRNENYKLILDKLNVLDLRTASETYIKHKKIEYLFPEIAPNNPYYNCRLNYNTIFIAFEKYRDTDYPDSEHTEEFIKFKKYCVTNPTEIIYLFTKMTKVGNTLLNLRQKDPNEQYTHPILVYILYVENFVKKLENTY